MPLFAVVVRGVLTWEWLVAPRPAVELLSGNARCRSDLLDSPNGSSEELGGGDTENTGKRKEIVDGHVAAADFEIGDRMLAEFGPTRSGAAVSEFAGAPAVP